ncbi:hypothetical protein Q9189_004456 [Teloschistes chrysophthalmus]
MLAVLIVHLIVSILAAAWSIVALFARKFFSTGVALAGIAGLIDLGFVGACIAGVNQLSYVANAGCIYKLCPMLKASFGLGVIDCILFGITAFLLVSTPVRFEKRGDEEGDGYICTPYARNVKPAPEKILEHNHR